MGVSGNDLRVIEAENEFQKSAQILNHSESPDPPGCAGALGEPTRPFLEAAVREGRAADALDWLDYYLFELAQIWYIFGVWNWYMARYYLDRKGDQAWADLLGASMGPWLTTTAGARSAISAQVVVEGHYARLAVPGFPWVFHLTEGDRHYELTLDAPAAQKVRWDGWRAAITTAIRTGDRPTLRACSTPTCRKRGSFTM